jgi:hypothetical protein
MQADVWTAWSAIAALFASGVALAVAAGPLIWSLLWHHPTLELTVKEEQPWVRVPTYDGKRTPSVWFRAQVENSGHAEARNVRAVVTDWAVLTDKGWTKIDLDPSALHWVSLPWARRMHKGDGGLEVRETAPVVNVPPGLSDLVDLISYNWENGEHDLVLDYDRPRGFLLRQETPEGEFVLTVQIVAENAKSLIKHIHYRITREGEEDEHLTEVGLQDDPLAVQAGRSGHSSQGNGERDSSRTSSESA